MTTKLRAALRLSFFLPCCAAYLSGCVVLVPFVEPDQNTKSEIQAARAASPITRREYRSKTVRINGPEDQKIERLMRQMKSPATIDRIYAAYDLGALGPKAAPAVPVLVEGLRDSTKYVRRASVKALAKIGHPACTALPDMKKSIADKDNFVGRSAENAVKKLQPVCMKDNKKIRKDAPGEDASVPQSAQTPDPVKQPKSVSIG